MKHIFHMDTRQVHSPKKKISQGVETSIKPSRKMQSLWKGAAFMGRGVLYVILSICILMLVCFGALFAYVKLYPQEISQKISQTLYTQAQIEVAFSNIDVTLLPLPALSLADVQLTHKDFSLSVAYATVAPSLWTLLQGEISLGGISLWRPVFAWKEHKNDEAQTNDQAQKKASNTPTAPVPTAAAKAQLKPELHVGALIHEALENTFANIPTFLYGSSLEIFHGKVSFIQGDWRFQCENVNSSLHLGTLGSLGGSIGFEDGRSFFAQEPVGQAHSFLLTISGDVDERFQARVQLQGKVDGIIGRSRADVTLQYTVGQGLPRIVSRVLPKALSGALPQAFWGSMQSEDGPLQIHWDVNTQLLWHEQALALHTQGKLFGNIQDTLHLRDVQVALEQDKAHLQATVHVADLENPQLTGHLQVDKLSLTQWFGFARHMPEGLQHTLHKVQGELDFTITKEGLEVPTLKAKAADAQFTGKGGVPSWSNAVVELYIHTPQLYLKNVYPEAEGIKSAPVQFRHKPLTPMPGSPEAAAVAEGISVGYDINVAADTLYAWELPVENMDFRACPIELDREKFAKKHKNAAVLAFTAKKFFGGRAEGKALLYRSESDESSYDIKALLRNVRAEKPVARIIGMELIGGRMSADASVTAKGIYAGEFLTSLGGSASIRVENGNFYSRSKRKVPFKVLTAAGTVSGLNPEKVTGKTWPSKLQYGGQWRVNLDTADISAKTSWNGALEFVGKDYGTVALNAMPGSGRISFAPSLTTLPHATEVDFRGEISLDTTKGVVSLAKAKGTVPSLAGMQAEGHGSLDFSNDITWKAHIKSTTKQMSSVLQRLDSAGESILPKTAPQHATLAMNMSYADELLRMDAIQMKLDTTLITGKMQRTFNAKPAWAFDLHASHFDFDKLIRGRAVDMPAPKPAAQAGTSAQKPLSWQWLQDLRAKGTVRIDTFTMNRIHVRNVVAPVNIQNSALDCTPTKAKLYGGDVVINFKSKVQKGLLHTQLGVVTKQANLLSLSHDLKLETAISGLADFWLSAQGNIGYSKDIPAAFDGTWRLHVGSGFLQSREESGMLSGSPTNFTQFSDAGSIRKGVLESHKFLLQGPDIYVTGKGHIDLMKDSLDMHLLVGTGGLSDIPVRFYGSLDDPQRDVHAGAVLLSAIGSLGTGVFDIIGGIFTAFFGLFK